MTPAGSTQQPRVFLPLYVSAGNEARDRLAFFHIIERLKTQKRTGWVDHKVVPNPESISDHMYRMSLLAMCTADADLDVSKCVMMCLVHDLAEAQVGDIAPREGIPKAEKRRLEAEAMHNFVHEMLHNSPTAQKIEALWQEYEDGESKEARFVKGKLTYMCLTDSLDLDRFEMAAQAFEYERDHGMKTLQPFFDSSLPNIRHPEVQGWGKDLLAEREQFKQAQQQDKTSEQADR
ncbi:HD domain-containing protein [Punctularia strigosozonata HHB-11173 SS5]|uniref:HD domain-containing protein n=1 Tax=Punctularia strigosozonata (strain HHB-11173) TaxID=741275 RepID=UPI0004417104|nr:HD domain-containing protein [Punctularia strigosozonata HHB-11173 SS5]EIN09460.1 HD domain-containing protein [Punctularia strigosozonata HHB-11173 SS5]